MKTSRPIIHLYEICSLPKAVISLLLLIFVYTISNAQTPVWTWVSGDNTTNSAGVYGTKGTAASTNKPGNRDSYCSWKDASGNFWLFGGWDVSTDSYNDLWKFNTSTQQWTWVSGDNTTNAAGVYGTKGTAAATNKPGARYGHTGWIDASGNFWILGGYGFDGAGNKGYLNDLWRYNTSTGQWTWVSGDNTRNNTATYGTKGTAAASNKPGGRQYVTGAADASGNFWIFGGQGYDGSNTGYLNDLWRYNPATGQWTWMSGDNSRNNSASYGTKGTAAATNKPGGRYYHSGLIDASGNFWVFGGQGYDGTTTVGYLNDLWKYTASTGQWTWIGGDNGRNSTGVYGTKGTAAATNKPGGRLGQSIVMDGIGNLWVFAGYGYDVAGNLGSMNDLWIYRISTGQWTWQSGDNTRNNTGVYGTQGTGVAANKPGSRLWASAWLDAASNLWTFGGYNAATTADHNDLWKFNLSTLLPIQEISLQGKLINNETVLLWQTKGEWNTARFIIEKSANGIDFTATGQVVAVGTGNNQYTFKDYYATGGTFYYRIQVQDINGTVYYSSIITLAGSTESHVSLYPNPARKIITLRISDNKLLNTTACLFDVSGRLVTSFKINNQQQNIDLHSFAKGIFNLRLQNGKTFILIKE